MKNIFLLNMLTLFFIHNTMACETLPREIYLNIFMNVVYSTSDFINENSLESFIQPIHRSKNFANLKNFALTNRKMFNIVKEFIIKENKDREIRNYNLMLNIKPTKQCGMPLFSSNYIFQFEGKDKLCLLSLFLIKERIERSNKFSYQIIIYNKVMDSSITVQENKAFMMGWADLSKLNIPFDLCMSYVTDENEKKTIKRWTDFISNHIMTNKDVVPAGDGSVNNTLTTIIYLDDKLSFTQKLFSTLYNSI